MYIFHVVDIRISCVVNDTTSLPVFTYMKLRWVITTQM